MEWEIWVIIGYAGFALLLFPIFYWSARTQHYKVTSDSVAAWGAIPALLDAIMGAVFWPVAIVAIIGWLIVAIATGNYVHKDRLKERVPRKNLIGPPENLTFTNNDMLMQVCRDYMVTKTELLGGRYYLDESIANALKYYMEQLAPYQDALYELGLERVVIFSRKTIIQKDSNDREYIADYGMYGSETVAILAETSNFLTSYDDLNYLVRSLSNKEFRENFQR